jgi:hypothetical protein
LSIGLRESPELLERPSRGGDGLKTFLQILQGLTLGLPAALRALLRSLCSLRGREAGPLTGCCTLNSPVVLVPDPLIYDQYYLWSLGLPFTWDNPDITIWQGGQPGAPWLGGTEVSPSSLVAGTAYQVVARIWNRSFDAPVAGLKVAFSYLSFGVGVVSNPIGLTHVNLGVIGGPDHPAFAVEGWTTPSTPGHYCIQVTLLPASDWNWKNNLGQENTQVLAAQSPALSSFALRNDTDERQAYEFRVDVFQISDLPPCPPDGTAPARTDLGSRLAALKRQPGAQTTPLPPGWTVTFDPASPVLSGSEETTIQVTIEPPAAFIGTQPINVHAFRAVPDSGQSHALLAGGLTFTVTKT